MSCFHFCLLDPKAQVVHTLAYCDNSFKTSRDRNLNPVKLFQMQNFTFPI